MREISGELGTTMNHIPRAPFAAATTATELTTIAKKWNKDGDYPRQRLEFVLARLAGGDCSPVIFAPLGVDVSKRPDYAGWRLEDIIDDQFARVAYSLMIGNMGRATLQIRAVEAILGGLREDPLRGGISACLRAELRRQRGERDAAAKAFQSCRLGAIADIQTARIHIEDGLKSEAERRLLTALDRLTGNEHSSILMPVCFALLAQVRPEKSFELLGQGYREGAAAPTLPTAEHLGLYCDFARELWQRQSLDAARRVLDAAEELCRRNQHLDKTCINATRGAVCLTQAEAPGEDDERHSDYFNEAIKYAALAHRNRRIEDSGNLTIRTKNYIALAYAVHGEAVGEKEFHRTLTRFSLAQDFAEASGDRELLERAQRFTKKMLQGQPPLLALTIDQFAAHFDNKVAPLTREKAIAYLLIVDRCAERLNELTGISKPIIQHTIRALDGKAGNGDMSDHVQAWRAAFPDGFRKQRRNNTQGVRGEGR